MNIGSLLGLGKKPESKPLDSNTKLANAIREAVTRLDTFFEGVSKGIEKKNVSNDQVLEAFKFQLIDKLRLLIENNKLTIAQINELNGFILNNFHDYSSRFGESRVKLIDSIIESGEDFYFNKGKQKLGLKARLQILINEFEREKGN